MTDRTLQIGDIITVQFPMQTPQGREQEGYRPAIVVGFPNRLGVPRFQLILGVPMTTDRRQNWAIAFPNLYPRFPAGIAGLSSPSIALLDQIRTIDVNRIINYKGSLTEQQYASILTGLQSMINPI